MKKVIAIFCYLAMVFPFLSAQNYRTIDPDRIAYFSNESGNIKCIRIDSVINEQDSVFFPFMTIRPVESMCYTPYGPSWIGEKVMINDSMNLFFNFRHDTIKIYPKASLDESWMVYELPGSMKITATVRKVDTMTFLDLKDSVKIIGFQVYDKTMSPVSHAVNSLSIIISRNFGFVEVPNFFAFPDVVGYEYPTDELEEYWLAGLSQPKTGIQNLTWIDIFDFQPGDEVHEYYESYYREFCDIHYRITKTISKYISRTDYPDRIVYDVDREQVKEEIFPDSSYEYTRKTIRKEIIHDFSLDRLPEEPIVSEYKSFAYTMTRGEPAIKSFPSALDLRKYNDTCWTVGIFEGEHYYCDYEYLEGLGGPYYYCVNVDCMGDDRNKLVYYKKGNKTWGTPLVITGIPKVEQNQGMEIYPNPVKECIHIKASTSDLPFLFELMDLSGKIMLYQHMNKSMNTIEPERNLKGIYIYRITDKSKTTHYGKLLLE